MKLVTTYLACVIALSLLFVSNGFAYIYRLNNETEHDARFHMTYETHNEVRYLGNILVPPRSCGSLEVSGDYCPTHLLVRLTVTGTWEKVYQLGPVKICDDYSNGLCKPGKWRIKSAANGGYKLYTDRYKYCVSTIDEEE